MSALKDKRCSGCNKLFTFTGFKSHLKQTKRAACIAIRDATGRVEDPAYLSGDNSSDDLSMEQDNGPMEVVAFEGDYYGNYSAEDFDNYEEFDGDEPSIADEDQEGVRLQEDIEAEDEDDLEAQNFEAEGGWEPPAPDPAGHPQAVPNPVVDADSDTVEDRRHDAAHRATQLRAQEHLRTKTFKIPFPGGRAGAPVNRPRERSAYESYQAYIDSANDNPYSPFISKIDWEFAKWAKNRGPGSTAVSELLEIENLFSLLGLSYRNSRELNTIIDEKLASGRPKFIRREIVVAGEVFEIFYRDVIQCIRSLIGDPKFAGLLVFAPEKHYADAGHTARVYFDVHTGKWWWETQKELEKRMPGATIIPIILSSDKTQLTVFGSKTAYPVYMTIGNLPKDIRRKPSRRGQILLAYLPTSRLEHIQNKAARRRTLSNLFHACMAHVLAPLKIASSQGIEIVSGDGVTRRGHPIFAMYIGDYPEQLLVTCCKNGTCPKCDIPRDDIGAATDPARPLRDLEEVLNALDKFNSGAAAYSKACREVGIKPVVSPFWKDLPHSDVFLSVTPDILHQLYQGVIKHLISWLKSAYGPDKLDARCRRLPPNHQIRLFLKGITTLQKVTSKEHGDICRFLLGLVIGLPLPGGLSPVRLIRAVRALLDFLYLAQYPAHSAATLSLLEDALRRFHSNKDIFVQLGIRQHFKLPKLHSLEHYIASIKLFGTTDNYNTQYTERLHIDFAKDAYRATNHKDEFPQMTTWLERREKIARHETYVNWRLRRIAALKARAARRRERSSSSTTSSASSAVVPQLPQRDSTLRRGASAANTSPSAWTRIKITKWPSVKALSFDTAADRYGARYLRDALARFVVQYRTPGLSAAEVEQAALAVGFRFRTMQAFHKLKFTLDDAQDLGIMDNVQDVAHARPERKDKQGRTVPGRFDTVLINDGTGRASGVQGYHVAQLRLVFRLPPKACEDLFPDVLAPGHLAYVERFTAFTSPDNTHGLYKVMRQRDATGARLASVVEVRNI
ncbi:hypothetical protein TRAPUB_10899 [Trametes pubescens]|uniref:C2H2-type domain-containing protein n=1 Tax=Trametes pubescens TaxID=154538 RepID=A0A1M2VY91_TRAPU|nr:hypothetical protein TRAPUB_10899 [Trametes pubescens]